MQTDKQRSNGRQGARKSNRERKHSSGGRGCDGITRTHCAYNQTRECFLGLEVTAAELSHARLEERRAERAQDRARALDQSVPGIPDDGPGVAAGPDLSG